MLKTCENSLILVNSCVYFAYQTCEIYQVLPYTEDFEAPREFEIHRVRQYLVNVVLFGINVL